MIVDPASTDYLNSYKLLVVQPVAVEADAASPVEGASYVAIDLVGTGEGETVLVTRGSAARVPETASVPTDAAIIAVPRPRREIRGAQNRGPHRATVAVLRAAHLQQR